MADKEPNEDAAPAGELQRAAAAEDHGHRHEAVRDGGGDGGDPRIRRPKTVHTTDQIVSMASRLGWTVGITAADLVGAQCQAVIGLAPQDEEWRRGENMSASGTAPSRTRRRGRKR